MRVDVYPLLDQTLTTTHSNVTRIHRNSVRGACLAVLLFLCMVPWFYRVAGDRVTQPPIQVILNVIQSPLKLLCSFDCDRILISDHVAIDILGSPSEARIKLDLQLLLLLLRRQSVHHQSRPSSFAYWRQRVRHQIRITIALSSFGEVRR